MRKSYNRHYVLLKETDPNLRNIDKIFFMMLSQLEKTYEDQEEIADCVNEKYPDTKMTQSKVSIAMNNMLIEIVHKNDIYGFVKNEEGYQLARYNNIHKRFEQTKQELLNKNILVDNEICKVSDTVFIYKLVYTSQDQKMIERFEDARDQFYRLLGTDVIFDIVLYGNLLVVMLKKGEYLLKDYSKELGCLFE